MKKALNISTRISWIDLLEVIAIFFVVLYHSSVMPADIMALDSSESTYILYYSRTILSTCVPLFFFVNGYLLFDKNLKIRNHIYKIIKFSILAIFWGFITLFILSVFNKETLNVHEFINDLLNWKQGYINHLWFLGALVCIYIFFPLLKIAYDCNKKIFFYFILVCGIFTFGNTLINYMKSIIYYFSFDKVLAYDYNNFNIFNPFRGIYGYTFVYFCLGGIIRLYFTDILKISKYVRNIVSIIGLFISCFGLFLIGVFYSKILGVTWDVVWNGYSSCFTLMNVLFIFNLSLNYKSNNIIIYLLSINTLGIYFIHVFLIHFIKINTLDITIINIFIQLSHSIFILIFSLCITLFLKKIPILKKLVC